MVTLFQNPFRPGAGHLPPYLVGRKAERQDFTRHLEQQPILTNLVLTGLRGVGKTVLLETFTPIAIQKGWLWAGTDLSESASVSEEIIAVRILADLALLVSGIKVGESEQRRIGFTPSVERKALHLDFDLLKRVHDETSGLASDKLKAVLEFVWSCLRHTKCRGVVLAYDEAQNLSDQAVKDIIDHSGGYPYFIQFLCREMFDSYLQQKAAGEAKPRVTVAQTVRKLDSDFFAGRWSRVTDRQRELLSVVAMLPNCDDEFSVLEIVEESKKALTKPFGASHVCGVKPDRRTDALSPSRRKPAYGIATARLRRS